MTELNEVWIIPDAPRWSTTGDENGYARRFVSADRVEELLTALKGVVCYGCHVVIGREDPATRNCVNCRDARKAIAKAEGRAEPVLFDGAH